MSIGCSIYLAPVDRSWIGTPDFLRGVANLFAIEQIERLTVWQIADTVPGVEPTLDESEKMTLEFERDGLSIEAAISAQRAGAGYNTIMYLPDSGAFGHTVAEAVLQTLPADLSEGWIPVEAAIHNGHWAVWDYGGDWVGGGACCVELAGGPPGYPVQMQEYLKAFMQVPAMVQFQNRLEELSSQAWSALIELT